MPYLTFPDFITADDFIAHDDDGGWLFAILSDPTNIGFNVMQYYEALVALYFICAKKHIDEAVLNELHMYITMFSVCIDRPEFIFPQLDDDEPVYVTVGPLPVVPPPVVDPVLPAFVVTPDSVLVDEPDWEGLGTEEEDEPDWEGLGTEEEPWQPARAGSASSARKKPSKKKKGRAYVLHRLGY